MSYVRHLRVMQDLPKLLCLSKTLKDLVKELNYATEQDIKKALKELKKQGKIVSYYSIYYKRACYKNAQSDSLK